MWKVIVITLCLNTIALAQLPDFSAPHHASRVLVRFQPSANQAARQGAHDDAGAVQVVEEYESFEDLQLVEMPEGNVEKAVMDYLDDPNVLYAEPDFERYPDAVCNSNDPLLVTATPDPLWGIKKVRAPEAWCLTTGSATFPIAVIDTGIGYNHPDLQSNIWVNAAECPGGFGACTVNGIDEDGNTRIDDFYGWDFALDDNDPIDQGDVAAPHVAGAAALIWTRHPTYTYSQVRNLILNTVHKDVLPGMTITGGRLDIGAALLDCNNNGVADGIDVNTFDSCDCNDNNIPDECESSWDCADCDEDDIPDVCDARGKCCTYDETCILTPDEDCCIAAGGWVWYGLWSNCLTPCPIPPQRPQGP